MAPKRTPQPQRSARSAAVGPLQQWAAMDRAIAALHQACGQLATVIERGDQLYQKLHHARETFIQAWNATHPEQAIPRCRGTALQAACTRYTTNPQALCDACQAQRTRG